MTRYKLGFALCGSFCTLARALDAMEALPQERWEIYPIMSETTYATDTRFGAARDFIARAEAICGREVIHTITGAEPIGPKGYLDILLIAPCTGNTLGKLACGITDTAVTMAAKAQLRNRKPVAIAVSTNDALAASARNIGVLQNAKQIYFLPMAQDDPQSKEASMVADFSRTQETLLAALEGRQLQPTVFSL